MNNVTQTPATTCPSWCDDHQEADHPLDVEHRKSFLTSETATVYVSPGEWPDCGTTVCWHGEHYLADAIQARSFADALHAAADKLEAIQGGAS